MRLLLDECMPRRLRREPPGHDVATVQDMAWAGLTNGELLRAAADAGFAALLTVDRGIEFQQSLRGLELSVLAIQANSNDINDLRPLMPRVEAACASCVRASSFAFLRSRDVKVAEEQLRRCARRMIDGNRS